MNAKMLERQSHCSMMYATRAYSFTQRAQWL